jgi:hypothetical protein
MGTDGAFSSLRAPVRAKQSIKAVANVMDCFGTSPLAMTEASSRYPFHPCHLWSQKRSGSKENVACGEVLPGTIDHLLEEL